MGPQVTLAQTQAGLSADLFLKDSFTIANCQRHLTTDHDVTLSHESREFSGTEELGLISSTWPRAQSPGSGTWQKAKNKNPN